MRLLRTGPASNQQIWCASFETAQAFKQMETVVSEAILERFNSGTCQALCNDKIKANVILQIKSIKVVHQII